MNVDYNALFREQAEKFKGAKLLLHCCCAPCASSCLERLKDYFKITVLFYNPNIDGSEYERRKAELIKFINATGWAEMLDCTHGAEDFYTAAAGLESEKEGGARCAECFKLRLNKTAELADSGGYDLFTTTLTLSPLKNARLINETGESAARGNAKWLYSDFKKRDGYKRSLELSKQYGLYRQNYCGCEFSRR